jgi:hypothetical protein
MLTNQKFNKKYRHKAHNTMDSVKLLFKEEEVFFFVKRKKLIK